MIKHIINHIMSDNSQDLTQIITDDTNAKDQVNTNIIAHLRSPEVLRNFTPGHLEEAIKVVKNFHDLGG